MDWEQWLKDSFVQEVRRDAAVETTGEALMASIFLSDKPYYRKGEVVIPDYVRKLMKQFPDDFPGMR